LNQLSWEQLKLPRGPETELHGNNLTKDAEQNGGYRLGLENCVLSETADHCFFRCQPPRVPPAPSRPVWPDVLSRDFLLRVKSVSSAHQPTRRKECWKIKKSKPKKVQTGIRVAVDSTAARLRENAVERSTRHSTTKTGGQSCAKAQGRWKTLRVGGAWQLHRFQGGLADGPFAGWPGRVGALLAASCVASCCCFTLLHAASCRFTLLCARGRRQNADLGTETHASGNYVVQRRPQCAALVT